MNVVLILALACQLTPVFGRTTITGKLPPDFLANKKFKACGPAINDVYTHVCQLANDSSVNFHKIFGRSKRGVVDECCLNACTLVEFSEYCPGKSNYRLLLRNQIRPVTQEPNTIKSTTGLSTNEVRKKKKPRRNGRRRRQPIVMPCMYRSYAHFLLRERRRLQGKITKKERTMSDAQHGTTGSVRVCETCSAPIYKTS